jgi:hypothetical protein
MSLYYIFFTISFINVNGVKSNLIIDQVLIQRKLTAGMPAQVSIISSDFRGTSKNLY